MVQRENQVKDRRIQRTLGLLREALASLIHQKSYDAISIKEILDRANVGRSTFYVHFGDKDDLLRSCIRDMFRSVQSACLPSPAKPHEGVVRFSLPVFEHIHQHRRAGNAPIGTRGRAILHEHLKKELVGLIADDVERDLQGWRRKTAQMSTDFLAEYVAATFVLVLNWWLESRSLVSPKEADDLFRALVLPTLAAARE